MTIGKKLTLCMAGMLAVVLALAGAEWYSGQSLGNDLKLSGVIATRAIIAGELSGNVIALREKQRGTLLYTLAHDNKRSASNTVEFRDSVAKVKAGVTAARALSTLEKGRTLLATVESDADKYASYFDQMVSLIAAGKTNAALILYRDIGSPVGVHAVATAQEYIELQKTELAEEEAKAASLTNLSRGLTAVFLLLGLAVVGGVTLIIRKITTHLRTMTSSLSDGATQIATGSTQVSSSSQSLAQGASEQASSLEETSASAEEVTSMTRQNAANTSQVAELMGTVDKRVAEGNSTLALMIESMKHINESSGKISKIIKVIDEIAFQTNILALNAAVEAARAGEAGMGFAVVADEVRNLAQRSAQAAHDTAALIEESIATSHEGSERLQRVADVVGSITEAADKVKVLVDEVNIGSQEQAKGIEEIARSLTEMDKVTQGTAAAAEESASASQQMSAQAQALAHIVAELRVMAG